jgi:hypothetical protein
MLNNEHLLKSILHQLEVAMAIAFIGLEENLYNLAFAKAKHVYLLMIKAII